MSKTLTSLKEALQQPFAPEMVRFLPKEIHQEHGKYVCLALPYANKRVYEDRLNELVFGDWSSPYTPPYAQGNKLIIPATVVILGVAHTDYGEAFMVTTGKGGTPREDENTATEAYSQAFRRACAKFLLGRYLYDLPKLKLPYDPKTRQLAITTAERIAWVEKLYMERGLKPRSYATPQRPLTQVSSQKQESLSTGVPVTLAAQSQTTKTTSAQNTASAQPATPALQQKITTPSVPQQQIPSAVKEPQPATYPTSYPHDTFLDWVATKVSRDPERIQGICAYYKVTGLAQLTTKQRNELTRRLRQQAARQQRQPTPLASAATPSV